MKIFSFLYFKHVLLAIIFFILLILMLSKWLDNYTMHGKEVEIPNVKGKKIEEVIFFFQKKNIKYQIVDSAFFKEKVVGSIIETIPPIGTKIKPGRTIYLIINSQSPLFLIVPKVEGMFKDEVKLLLKSIGFKSLAVKIIDGEHKDLVVRLETERCSRLNVGDRLLANDLITIVVFSGSPKTIE